MWNVSVWKLFTPSTSDKRKQYYAHFAQCFTHQKEFTVIHRWMSVYIADQMLLKNIPVLFLEFKEKKNCCCSWYMESTLQIAVHKADMDFLRLLWKGDSEGINIRMFRHTSCIFGVKLSHFRLVSVIECRFKNYEQW